MRKSAPWMSIWDDRILEFIGEQGTSSVGEISDSQYIRISGSHVSRRCKELADHGLLLGFANGVYAISDLGQQYLDEEIDADELEDVNGGESVAGA
jgi:predicted transcriptional regulator